MKACGPNGHAKPPHQVYKLRQADDYTGTNLLKALGAKSFLVGRSAPKARMLCLSVK
jgi:hypothetical protein